MPTIGYATLQIVPSLRGISAAIDRELDSELRGRSPKVPITVDEAAARRAGQRGGRALSDAVERETRGLGSKIGNFFDPSVAMAKVGRAAGGALTTAMHGAVLGGAGVVAGALGATLFKGFERLQSIDDAKFKLQALGNSAQDVQTIMDSALASVKGTSFGLGDAATVAANAVAAGVKPGQDLTKYLKTTADAAAIAKVSLSDMGQIINQVHTGQKAYTDDLNQLADRGLPIYQWLGDQLHISSADVKQFAADGKISSADFEQAIQTHIGGAALTMGQSFSGAVQNAEAALGRLGAAFLQPAFANAGGGLGSITSGLDKVTAWIDGHQGTIINFWKTMGDAAITGAQNFAHGIGGALQALGDLVGGLGNVKGVLDNTMAFFADLKGDHAGADEFRKSAQEAFGWGESIRAAGDKLVNADFSGARTKVQDWANAAHDASNQARNAAGEVAGLGSALGAMPPSKNISVNVDVAAAQKTMNDFFNSNSNRTLPVGVNPNIPSTTPGNDPLRILGGGRAGGGRIAGPGGPTSDIIPIWASNGEHILTASDVAAMGGQAGVYAFREALHRAGGGAVGGMTADQVKKFAAGIAGHAYVWGGGNGDTFATDCSGAQSTVANFITGGKGRFATASEASALQSRGFKIGDPPPGVSAYWVGWLNGGPGGGHTAGTIVDPFGGNTNVEMGGAAGNGQFGGSAAGASGFPNRAWIALGSGDNPAKDNFAGAASSPFAGGSAAAAVTQPGGASASSGSGGGASSGGGSLNLPSSLSGFGKFAGGKLGDLSKLGEAAGSLVDGQVASALGVFGVGDSPGWLKGISQLIGGVSIGGSGQSASPLAANPTGTGTLPPDPGNMHGGRAGQQPGPQVVINARDTEDAFVRYQRLMDERAAAKLSRF